MSTPRSLLVSVPGHDENMESKKSSPLKNIYIRVAHALSAKGINSIAEAMTLTDDKLKSMDVVRTLTRFE